VGRPVSSGRSVSYRSGCRITAVFAPAAIDFHCLSLWATKAIEAIINRPKKDKP
jgi:hypothetical protein